MVRYVAFNVIDVQFNSCPPRDEPFADQVLLEVMCNILSHTMLWLMLQLYPGVYDLMSCCRLSGRYDRHSMNTAIQGIASNNSHAVIPSLLSLVVVSREVEPAFGTVARAQKHYG